ncbi:MAG TPA: hypothetical protein PK733_19000 [Clostridiales bacterium]|nr:hypothetical protein [Clostridiales bacterium]
MGTDTWAIHGDSPLVSKGFFAETGSETKIREKTEDKQKRKDSSYVS